MMVKAALAGAVYCRWACYEDKVRELDIPEIATVLNDGSVLYSLYGRFENRTVKKIEVKNEIEIRIPCLNVNSKNTKVVGIKHPDLIYLSDKRIFVDKKKLENNAFRVLMIPQLAEEAQKNLEGLI